MLPIPKTNANIIEPKEGSSLYYSLLYCDDATRSRYLNVLTLIDTVERTLDGVREHHVAETKIHWWHEEIERLFNGNARHPETKNCVDILGADPESKDHLLAILSATSSERLSDTKTDNDALERITSDFSARLYLLQTALANSDPGTTSPLALGLGLHHRLNSLPRMLQQGLEVFSEEFYKRYESSPAQLLENSENKLMRAATTQAYEALKNGLQHMDEHARNAHALPIITMARLREQQLRLWHKRTPNLVSESITLTPLRKFYIAWRTRKLYG